MNDERCLLCGCRLHRTRDTYARPTVLGRSHATEHHFVAERFFGRSSNRRGTLRDAIFEACPWGKEGVTGTFCYECHEELLHNPVLLPEDVARFQALAERRGCAEIEKDETRSRLAGRIRLLQEVISTGLRNLEAGTA